MRLTTQTAKKDNKRRLVALLSATVVMFSGSPVLADVHHLSAPNHVGKCITHRCDKALRAWSRHHPLLAAKAWARHHPQPKPKWVLPAYVMECESHFTNEARHVYGPGIDPAGYYQIISSTWDEHNEGIPGPLDASRHSKHDQDIVATRILHSGGLSEWQCA